MNELERERRLKALYATEIGGLFKTYEAAVAQAWASDHLNYNEERRDAFWTRANAARNAWLSKLAELAGTKDPNEET